MKAEAAQHAARLLAQCRTAALATLHEGAPGASLAPFACLLDPFGLVIHVSRLAAHTRDMLTDARVAVMVAQPEAAGAPVHALARVSIAAIARALAEDELPYAAARAAYAERFPEMAALFSLGDFGLFLLEPTAVRVVTGFAQAASITPESLRDALRAQGTAS